MPPAKKKVQEALTQEDPCTLPLVADSYELLLKFRVFEIPPVDPQHRRRAAGIVCVVTVNQVLPISTLIYAFWADCCSLLPIPADPLQIVIPFR